MIYILLNEDYDTIQNLEMMTCQKILIGTGSFLRSWSSYILSYDHSCESDVVHVDLERTRNLRAVCAI